MDFLDQNPENTPTQNDNQMAMWAHLIGIISCISGFLGLIGTLVFYFVNREKSDYIRKHAAQAFNFQIVYFASSMLLGLLLVGTLLGSFAKNVDNEQAISSSLLSGFGLTAVLGGAFFIINLVVCIMSALSANKGEFWKNPLALPMVK